MGKVLASFLFLLCFGGTPFGVGAQTLPCAFVGDSIAVGAGAAQRGCAVLAKVGISARQWMQIYGSVQADRVLISVGSNDHGANVAREMGLMRMRIAAREVIWIAPSPQFAVNRSSVLAVAGVFGDVVYERPYRDVAPDNIHFTRHGYRKIAGLL